MGRCEHFSHEADMGIRGFGATKAEADRDRAGLLPDEQRVALAVRARRGGSFRPGHCKTLA